MRGRLQGDTLIDFSQYEVTCPACNGTKDDGHSKIILDPNFIIPTCATCDGKGRILTPEGREFVGFHKRWLK